MVTFSKKDLWIDIVCLLIYLFSQARSDDSDQIIITRHGGFSLGGSKGGHAAWRAPAVLLPGERACMQPSIIRFVYKAKHC